MAIPNRQSFRELQLAELRRDMEEEKRRGARQRAQNRSVRGVPAPKEGFSSGGGRGPAPKEGFSSGGGRGGWSLGPPAGRGVRSTPALDTHEILKAEMFGSPSGRDDNHFEKNRPSPFSVYGVSDQYMVLDSFEKVQGSRTDRGEFQFNFAVQGVTKDQNIGVKDKIDTVIGVQTCEFCVPLLPLDNFAPASLTTLNPSLSLLGLAPNGALPAPVTPQNPQTQVPFCGSVTMFMREIGLQSFSDVNNRRHHFEYKTEVVLDDGGDPDRLRLTPLKHCEYYIFTDPIQDVDGLTLCFYNPGEPLKFSSDCLYGTTARSDGTQLLEFTYADPTNLINLEVDDRVFVRGFAALNPTSNAGSIGVLNRYVNRPEGHLVGAGGFAVTAPTGPSSGTVVTFRLNPDVDVSAFYAAGVAIGSSKQIDVCIAKNRVRIPLRFRRVVDRLTNYITP